jgi:predicted secreted protein
MNPNGTLLPLVERLRGRALVVGVGFLALAILARLVAPDTFLQTFDRAYLFTFVFFLGLSLGSLALLMLHRQLGGAWGFLIRRPLEAGAMTIPLMLVLFIPVLVDLEHIYPWVKEHEAGESKPVVKAEPPSPVKVFKSATEAGPSGILREPLQHEPYDASGFKRWWLSPVTFTVRVAIYFTIWIVMALVLFIGSRRQDETGSTSLAYGLQSFSAPGLVVYFLTTSFAFIDWGMSLEPEWYSTIYGVLIMIGQVVSTMAFMILVAAVISGRNEVEGLDKPETFNDLGNLLLAFTMLWTYISFSQFLIIWAGNLLEEIPWYIRRFHGGYLNVGRFLMLFHFAVPFLLLLARPLKRNISALWKIAALVLFAHLIEAYWLIVPSFGATATPLRPSLLDLAAPIGVGGIWLATFLWFLKSRPLMVAHDPELLPALKQAGGH